MLFVHSSFPSEQLVSGFLVCFCSLVLLSLRPYPRRGDMTVAVLAMSSLSLTLLCGHVLDKDVHSTSSCTLG